MIGHELPRSCFKYVRHRWIAKLTSQCRMHIRSLRTAESPEGEGYKTPRRQPVQCTLFWGYHYFLTYKGRRGGRKGSLFPQPCVPFRLVGEDRQWLGGAKGPVNPGHEARLSIREKIHKIENRDKQIMRMKYTRTTWWGSRGRGH
jgi:hypothetical protein